MERLVLDGYDVEELIGFGGSGEVWRAVERRTGETVALKRLRVRDAGTEALRREAAILAAVAGPHVVRVRDVVTAGGEVVLVMEHAAGGSLATVLGVRGTISAAEVVTVLAPLAGALAAMHAQGVVHGDVTPANILFMADVKPLLADTGLAVAVAGAGDATRGTAEFLDPAVARGGSPTPAADVFGLAAVGYAALSGRPPWLGDSREAVLTAAAAGERPGLADLVPDAPERLVAALEAGMAADPRDRPDARHLATSVLLACACAPVQLVGAAALPPPPPATGPIGLPGSTSDPAPQSPERPRPLRPPVRRVTRPMATVAAAAGGLALAVAVGHAWARHGAAQAARLPAAAPSTPAAAPSPATTPTPPTDWSAVVRQLDGARMAALRSADPALLSSVYLPSSAALRGDLATVTSLASRGLRVTGFTDDIRSVTPLHVAGGRATLRVVDTLSPYRLVDAAGGLAGQGPGRGEQAMTVSLRNVGGQWRIAAVRRAAHSSARSAASTSS